MKEFWNGQAIVDLSREFLSSNGAERHADAHVLPGRVWQPQWSGRTFTEKHALPGHRPQRLQPEGPGRAV